MLPYNTDYKPLTLREYGRLVQDMVDYCVSIPFREERTACAYAIAAIMKNMIKTSGNNNDVEPDDKQIWDQIALMSDFKLDIEFPCEVITRDTLQPQPAKIPYGDGRIAIRNYGKIMERYIAVAAAMEPGPKRDELVRLLLNQMKKMMTVNNPQGAVDSRIIADFDRIAGNELVENTPDVIINDYVAPEEPVASKKKKRK